MPFNGDFCVILNGPFYEIQSLNLHRSPMEILHTMESVNRTEFHRIARLPVDTLRKSLSLTFQRRADKCAWGDSRDAHRLGYFSISTLSLCATLIVVTSLTRAGACHVFISLFNIHFCLIIWSQLSLSF